MAGLSVKDRALIALFVGAAVVLVALVTAGGYVAGRAVTGDRPGAVAGAVIGLSAFLLAFQRLFLRETWIECGCLQVILWVCGVAVYLALRW